MSPTVRPVARRAKKTAPAARVTRNIPDDHKGWQLLRRGIDSALHDLGDGRDDLRAALALFTTGNEAAGCLIAAAAIVLFIGIADDDYRGFQEAVEVVASTLPALEMITDADQRLIARSGALIAGWFQALHDPALLPAAESITRELADSPAKPGLRCCAGLATLAFFDARASLEGVLWVELAMRPVVNDAAVSARLLGEWRHALVQALYQCAAPERAEAVRAQHAAHPVPDSPAVQRKHELVQAQMAIGDGRVTAGRAALQRAEPLLQPRAPRSASWWHLLQSRLELLADRHHEALIHARLALRLAGECHFPERWMGVTVMQEGHVQTACGAYANAVPFFVRAGRAASGTQADFCWCLAHFARALAHFASGTDDTAGRAELAQGLSLAQRLHWLHFFRASPRVASQVCALGLEHQIETAFVREVIAARGLDAVRTDLAAWPWPIRVLTLGRFQIERDGKTLAFSGKVARKPLELLQFTIASGGSDVSVTTVMFGLWRDLEGDNARSAFTVALHRLRKLLGSDDAVRLELGRVSLNANVVWVDCLAFEQLIDGAAGATGAAAVETSPRAAADLARALAMYGGHFLHDVEDESWQLVCRTRLASKFRRAVLRLVRADNAARGDRAHRLRGLLERALELDPVAEDVARELMQLLGNSGEQAAALNVFEQCKGAIARMLGAKPAPATLALVARIRALD